MNTHGIMVGNSKSLKYFKQISFFHIKPFLEFLNLYFFAA